MCHFVYYTYFVYINKCIYIYMCDMQYVYHNAIIKYNMYIYMCLIILMFLHLIGTSNSIMYTIASLSLPCGYETLGTTYHLIISKFTSSSCWITSCFLMILWFGNELSRFSRNCALKLFLFTWLPQQKLGKKSRTYIWLYFPGPFCNDWRAHWDHKNIT